MMLPALTEGFLAAHGWAGARPSSLAEAGASQRQYTRLTKADGQTCLLVYTPAVALEQVTFRDLTDSFIAMGLSAPMIYASDANLRLMLVEDFGDASFSRLIASGQPALPLHLLAVDVLLEVERRFEPASALGQQLPHYTFALWRMGVDKLGLDLLFSHYFPPIEASAQSEFWAIWQKLLAPYEALPVTLLLRDFKPANLMWLEGRTGVQRCGLLDFQDSGIGCGLYALVELVQAWRAPIAVEVRETVLARYAAAHPELEPSFIRSGVMLYGAIRWLTWLATCAKYATQGRPSYSAHIPLIWRVVDECLADPQLSALQGWLARYRGAP